MIVISHVEGEGAIHAPRTEMKGNQTDNITMGI